MHVRPSDGIAHVALVEVHVASVRSAARYLRSTQIQVDVKVEFLVKTAEQSSE